jgi:hypothetical protein
VGRIANILMRQTWADKHFDRLADELGTVMDRVATARLRQALAWHRTERLQADEPDFTPDAA